MIYPVKIYDKFMKLIKTITSTEMSETFWREKNRKRDASLSNTTLKALQIKNGVLLINKSIQITCVVCKKKVMKNSARAKYCSEKCRRLSKKRRDDESKAKRNNTGRKSKKRVR